MQCNSVRGGIALRIWLRDLMGNGVVLKVKITDYTSLNGNQRWQQRESCTKPVMMMLFFEYILIMLWFDLMICYCKISELMV